MLTDGHLSQWRIIQGLISSVSCIFPAFLKFSYKPFISLWLDLSGIMSACLPLKSVNDWAQWAAFQFFSLNYPRIHLTRPLYLVSSSKLSDRWPQMLVLWAAAATSHPASPGLGNLRPPVKLGHQPLSAPFWKIQHHSAEQVNSLVYALLYLAVYINQHCQIQNCLYHLCCFFPDSGRRQKESHVPGQ